MQYVLPSQGKLAAFFTVEMSVFGKHHYLQL
jgi:hypothetical protein